MSNNIEMREVKKSDIKEIVFLHNNAYNEQGTPEHWIWEYKGIYPDEFVFTIIRDKAKNRLVGTQGMIPVYLNIKGKRYFTGKTESDLLDLKYRGGTLFQELYEFSISHCKLRNMYFIWGGTSAAKVWRNKLKFTVYENSMKESKIILNLGATLFETIKSKLKIVKISIKTKQTTFKKTIIVLLNKLSKVYNYLPKFKFKPTKIEKPISINGNFIIEPKLRSINDLKMLYSRLRKKYPNIIHIEQDEKFFNWRILNNPLNKYETYFVYDDNLLRAYCYLNSSSSRIAYLTDLTFDTSDVGKFLMDKILKKLRDKKVAYLYFIGNIDNPLMSKVFELLKTYGAIIDKYSQFFVIRNLSYSDEKYLHEIKNWYINGLWSIGKSI